MLPNSFYEANITLIPNREGQYKEGKLQANSADENRCKIPQQNIAKPNTAIH